MEPLTQQQLRDIRANPDGQQWCCIFSDFILSEDFIREFQDKIIWPLISCKQKLSESFFIEFKNKLFYAFRFKNCCYFKNYNNVKLFLKHGMKLNNESRKYLIR